MALVVVGVDGSEQSRRALAWAVDYAGQRGATVEAVMTVPTHPGDDLARVARWTDAEERLAALVEAVLQDAPVLPTLSYEVVEGDPVTVLVDASRDAELVVLGSRGMSKLRNPALGSVSLACIRFGSAPVVVIPVETPVPATQPQGAALALA